MPASHFTRHPSPQNFPGLCLIFLLTWDRLEVAWQLAMEVSSAASIFFLISTMESGLQALDDEAIVVHLLCLLQLMVKVLGPESSNEKATSLSASQHLFFNFRPFFSSLYLLSASIYFSLK